jgi:hypothetical protein
MIFVCLSHFALAYLSPHGATIGDFMILVSMLASPTFMLVSGMTVGCLVLMYPRDVARLQLLLLDRGLFLLVVGHIVLAGAMLQTHSPQAAYSTGFITDAIAVAMIIGPRITARVPMRSRAIAAALLYTLNWILIVGWHPSGGIMALVKYRAIGELPATHQALQPAVFPVLPWFAVYLVGTVLGQHFARQLQNGMTNAARRSLLVCGAVAMLAGLLVHTAIDRFEARSLAHLDAGSLELLAAPAHKAPPGFVYLLFFGGAGLMVVWLVLALDARNHLRSVLSVLRHFGKASLLVFLVQEYLYFVLLRRWNPPYTRVWPLLYLASLVPLVTAAMLWNRINGNRWFTVGLTALARRRAVRRRRERAPFVVVRA